MRSVWGVGWGHGGKQVHASRGVGGKTAYLPAGYCEAVGESGTEEGFGQVHTENTHSVCLCRGTSHTSLRENVVGLRVALCRFVRSIDSFTFFFFLSKYLFSH